MTQDQDALWMRRALRLAVRSLGRTWPNPGVGCVLVRDGQLIGQGRHEVCGEAHAEINALQDCQQQGYAAKGACAYVSLAPCTTVGRTGACSQALIEAGVSRVVAAVADPIQDDAAAVFKAAGIAYRVGCEERLARDLHGGFLQRVLTGRPRLTAKWAMTLDGHIATHQGHSQWISHADALLASRRRRRVFDGILIGGATARADNPALLSRCTKRSPVRLVASAAADIDLSSRLVTTCQEQPLWLLHAASADAAQLESLRAVGVRCVLVDPYTPQVMAACLGEAGLNEVLVEGGGRLHGAFLQAGLYDRVECYLAARTIGGGRSAASGAGVAEIQQGQAWEIAGPVRQFGDTVRITYRADKREQA